jgi:hypothetical protein
MIWSRRFSLGSDRVSDRVWCALFDRSAWSVPAGCPEPYLYDRLFSGSEIAVGVEAASANSRVTNHPAFSDTITAQNVYQS